MRFVVPVSFSTMLVIWVVVACLALAVGAWIAAIAMIVGGLFFLIWLFTDPKSALGALCTTALWVTFYKWPGKTILAVGALAILSWIISSKSKKPVTEESPLLPVATNQD